MLQVPFLFKLETRGKTSTSSSQRIILCFEFVLNFHLWRNKMRTHWADKREQLCCPWDREVSFSRSSGTATTQNILFIWQVWETRIQNSQQLLQFVRKHRLIIPLFYGHCWCFRSIASHPMHGCGGFGWENSFDYRREPKGKKRSLFCLPFVMTKQWRLESFSSVRENINSKG